MTKPLMTDNWLNTRAGQHLANHTIPSLTEALNRLSDKLEEPASTLKRESGVYVRVADKIGKPDIDEEIDTIDEIQRAMNWRPSPLEILLYRALSRLYGGDTSDDATQEAINALSYASYDFRNVLTEHTWKVDEWEPSRVEWDFDSTGTVGKALIQGRP